MSSLRASASTIIGRGQRDAARRDIPEMAGWTPPVGWGGAPTTGDMSSILGRARDLDENNAWVNGGLDRRVESVIGGNIRLRAQPMHRLLKRDANWRRKWSLDVQDRFRVWANDTERRCDAGQRLSFGAMAKVAYLSYMRDGEALGEVRDDARGLDNTTNLMLLAPERLSHPEDRGLIEGPLLRRGIEMDRNGAPVAYYIRETHPNDPHPAATANYRWERIPARGITGRAKIVHVFSPRRVEQVRGISRLAEAMVPAKMVDRVDRAEVQAALKSAILSFFIKSPGTTDDVEAMLAPDGSGASIDPWIAEYLDYRSEKPVRLDGATISHLLPGEDVVTPDRTSPNSNYPDFVKFVLQKIASSLGISYPQLSQDWAGINYSSARALLNELWRSFLEDRLFFCQQFLTPIYAAWLEVEVALGTVKIPGGPAKFYENKTAICMCEWIGPGRGSVDPLKEANAQNLNTAAGRASTIRYIYEDGGDPDDVLADQSDWLDMMNEAGLPTPNYNTKAGEAGASDGGEGGSEDDRDGDGIPNEGSRRRPQQEEASR